MPTGKPRKGDLIRTNSEEQLPFLCSRAAVYYDKGLENLVESAEEIGFPLVKSKDSQGSERPFVVFDNVFAVEGSQFEPDFRSFASVCEVFPNGYMASRSDFQTFEGYKRVIASSKWALFRAKVARHKSVTMEPSESCNVDAEMYKRLRKRFNLIKEDGEPTVGGSMLEN
ncbi:hypothetical protein OSTOST_00484 [Ostertagia ostertagi]